MPRIIHSPEVLGCCPERGDDFVAAEVIDGDFAVAAFLFEEVAEGGLGGDGHGGLALEEEFFPEGLYHGADLMSAPALTLRATLAGCPCRSAPLVGDDNGAVELGFGDGLFFVLDGPAFLAGEAVALLVVEAGVELGAALGDLGLYPVDVVADVDAIGDGLDVGVFGDEVAVEEAEGGFAGGGGEADEEGVEVVENLPPEVVDGAVAFIDDDDVEGFDGDGGVVGDGERFVAGCAGAVQLVAGVFVGFVVEFVVGELGVEALDGGDGDAADGVDAGGAEHLDVVEVGEFAAVVGGGELLEFVDGLAAEVAAVDEEEDALGTGVLDEAVGLGDGGVGLAGAGSHLEEGAGAVVGEGDFEAGDGGDLAVSEGGFDQRVTKGDEFETMP